VAGRTPPSENSKRAKGSQPTKFYAVATGRKPGIYTDWDTAHTQAIIGVKGPKYKKFATRVEAENFIRLYGSLETITALGLVTNEDDGDVDDDDDDDDEDGDGEEYDEDEDEVPPVSLPPAKKTRVDVGEGVKVLQNTDGVNLPVAGFHDGVLHIYTDGASKRNGTVTAKGGLGVFFGHNDPR
jgi:ribonuclease HI